MKHDSMPRKWRHFEPELIYHRFIEKKVRASQCFKSFHTVERTLEGIEAMNLMRKGRSKD